MLVLFCFERKTEQGTKFWINDEETDGTLIMKAVTNRLMQRHFVYYCYLSFT